MWDYNHILMVLYSAVWIITFIHYQKRKRAFDPGSFVLLSFIFYSVCSFFLFDDPYWGNFKDLSIWPYIYLYTFLFITCLPVFRYNDNKFDEIQKPNEVAFNVISIIIIIGALLNLPSKIATISDGITKLYLDSAVANDLHRDSIDESLKMMDGTISNIGDVISNTFSNICILFTLYYFTLKNRNKFISIGLCFSVIVGILSFISMGQRGGIMYRIMTLIITYLALNKYYTQKAKKIVRYVIFIVSLFVIYPVFQITIGRFSADTEGGTSSSLIYYMGQENLYFNNYGFDNGGIRYGDRTFSLYKRLLFDDVPLNFEECRAKYPNLKINDEVFVTYVGDLTLDFGPVVAPIIMIVFTLIILSLTRIRNRTLMFHQLLLYHLIMCIVIQGGMGLFTFSYSNGLKLVLVFVLCIFFKAEYSSRSKIRTYKQLP